MLRLTTPAKINLTLEVLGKRADGYHEVRTILQAVGLCDRLSFDPAPSFAYSCDDPAWESGASLVSTAAGLMEREDSGRRGARISVEKRIPLVAGLGGDASDAAAVLRGLNTMWGLGLSLERLDALATELGSDVPFFLRGGTVLAEGRGELLRSLPALPRRWVVLLVPDVPVPAQKTAALYARLDHGHFTDGKRTGEVMALIARGEPVDEHICNAFDGVADGVFPGLARFRAAFREAGASAVHMAGAGPVLFSLHPDRAAAAGVARPLLAQGWPVFVVPTLGAILDVPC